VSRSRGELGKKKIKRQPILLSSIRMDGSSIQSNPFTSRPTTRYQTENRAGWQTPRRVPSYPPSRGGRTEATRPPSGETIPKLPSLVILSSQFVGTVAVVAVFYPEDMSWAPQKQSKGPKRAREREKRPKKKRKEEERPPSSTPASRNERDAPKGEARESRPHREKGRKAGAGAADRPTGPKKEFAPMQIKKEGPSP